MGRRSRLRRAALWAASLRDALRLRPGSAMPALAALGELFEGGVSLRCPAPGGGGFSATFALDGGAVVRITTVPDALAAGAAEALARFGERLAAGRKAVGAMRAALDVLVALAAVAVAAVSAVEGGGGWGPALRFALVSAAYAALIPLRNALTHLALRGLAHLALRRFRTRGAP